MFGLDLIMLVKGSPDEFYARFHADKNTQHIDARNAVCLSHMINLDNNWPFQRLVFDADLSLPTP